MRASKIFESVLEAQVTKAIVHGFAADRDVIIIGRGPTGLMTAMELSKLDW